MVFNVKKGWSLFSGRLGHLWLHSSSSHLLTFATTQFLAAIVCLDASYMQVDWSTPAHRKPLKKGGRHLLGYLFWLPTLVVADPARSLCFSLLPSPPFLPSLLSLTLHPSHPLVWSHCMSTFLPCKTWESAFSALSWRLSVASLLHYYFFIHMEELMWFFFI